MKRIFTALLALCILFLCACSGDPSPSASQDASASAGVTATPESSLTTGVTATTESTPSTPATPLPTDEDGKNLIEGFEEGTAAELVSSLDWSGTGYGISNPELSITDAGADLGKGYKVFLPDGNAWCQSFTLSGSKVSDAFAKGGKYIRLWVNNQTEGTVGIGIVAYAGSSSAYFDVTNAKLYGADGTEFKAETADSSGMGQGKPSAVIVPAGFQGWLSMPANELCSYWSSPLLSDVTKTERLNIDVRPTGYTPETYYIFDELALTSSAVGATREWNNTGSGDSTDLSKSEQIANGMKDAIATTPQVVEMSEYNPTGVYSGIKAVWFDGMTKNGKKTKVFAYIGFPKNASASNKVPAVVLMHGGGGHAFLPWVKMWNDRGYAAIAIDNTGYFPTAVNAGSSETDNQWKYGLPSSLRQDGYTSAPNNDGMYSSSGKVESMWMYHAVGQSILAANILRADSRVDSSKVGITGISWGGVITSITIGYDDRFSFAIPIYGSGYLDEALSWMKDNFAGKDTQELWSAQDRFDKVTMPVLWLCWNDDSCFSVNSNSKSYLDTVKLNADTRLSMINNMYHSHGCGWAPGESMAFADSVVKGSAKLTGFKTQPSGKTVNTELTVDPAASKVTAKLYYITEKMTYSSHVKYGYEATFMDQEWQTASLTVNGSKISGTVPANAKGYYIEVKTTINGKEYVTCSVYTEV